MMKKLLAMLATLFLSNSVAGLELGDEVPDFNLPGSDGRMHRLSEYRGQVVVLAWFPKAFTSG